MPFRPLTEGERKEVLEKIERAKEDVATRDRYLQWLRDQLADGVWYSEWKEGKIQP